MFGLSEQVQVSIISGLFGMFTMWGAIKLKERNDKRKASRDWVEEAFDNWENLFQKAQDENKRLREMLESSMATIDRQQKELGDMRLTMNELTIKLVKSQRMNEDLYGQLVLAREQYSEFKAGAAKV